MKQLILLLSGSLLILPICARALASPPEWWSAPATSIIEPGAPVNNYAPANLGQLKHVATQARKHLDATLPGGAGSTVSALVDGFTDDPATNFAPINLGQLKAVAKPFYQRLLAAGFDTKANLIARGFQGGVWAYDYPWDPLTPVAENYAPANLGQVKMVFSFDLLRDDDQPPNGLPDWWEMAHFGQSGTDPQWDPDGDGLSNLREFQLGRNPISAFSQAGWVSDMVFLEYGGIPAEWDASWVADPGDLAPPAITILSPVGATEIP